VRCCGPRRNSDEQCNQTFTESLMMTRPKITTVVIDTDAECVSYVLPSGEELEYDSLRELGVAHGELLASTEEADGTIVSVAEALQEVVNSLETVEQCGKVCAAELVLREMIAKLETVVLLLE